MIFLLGLLVVFYCVKILLCKKVRKPSYKLQFAVGLGRSYIKKKFFKFLFVDLNFSIISFWKVIFLSYLIWVKQCNESWFLKIGYVLYLFLPLSWYSHLFLYLSILSLRVRIPQGRTILLARLLYFNLFT